MFTAEYYHAAANGLCYVPNSATAYPGTGGVGRAYRSKSSASTYDILKKTVVTHPEFQ
jgi:hypothetical protein